MSSYIDANLMREEKVIYRTKPHWIIFSNAIWMGILFLAAITIIPTHSLGRLSLMGYHMWEVIAFVSVAGAALMGFLAYIEFISSEFGITNKRVLIKLGFISRSSLEVLLPRIESISVIQSIPGRLFQYGTIIIAGTGGSKDAFRNIPQPLAFRKLIQEQVDQYEEEHI